MRVFYFLLLSLTLSFFALAQGNLPFEYMGIEYGGTIYHDGDVITICGDQDQDTYAFNGEYLPLGLSGDEYIVQSIPFTDVYPLEMENWLFPDDNGNGLLEPSEVSDDTFSDIFDLPFTFCYFGETYTQLKVGTNGRITFDTSQTYDGYVVDFEDTLPTTYFAGNTIFGVYQDTNPADSQMDFDPNDGDGTSNITYGIYGEEPFRAFVASYSQMPIFGFSCNDMNDQSTLMQTYQIILHEGTNVIDVIVWNRDSCPAWQDGLGIIGIQNENATIAYTPPGRNTGQWEAEMEAWRFIPETGGIGSANTITWDLNDEYAGFDGTLVTELQSGSNTLAFNNEYFMSCVNDIAIASVEVTVDYINVTLEEEEPISICEGGMVTLHAEQDYDMFAWYQDDVLIEGETGNTLEVTESGLYKVEYTTEDCTVSDEVEVIVVPTPEATDVMGVFCDNDGNGSEMVDLSQYFPDMIDMPENYTISVHESQEEADNNENAIDTNYELTTGSSTVYVRFGYDPDCYVTASIMLTLDDQLVLTPFTISECMPDTADQLNLDDYQSDIVAGEGYSFTYYESMEDAENGQNAISSIVSRQFGTTVYYVKVVADSESACEGITTITLTYYEYPELNEVMYQYCYEGEGMQVDLNNYLTDISIDNTLSFEFYNSMEDAENQNGAISNIYPLAIGNYVIYVRAENSNGCASFTSISIEVYDNPMLQPVVIEDCANEDLNYIFDLTSVQDQHSSDTTLNYSYFTSMSDAENNINAITESETTNYPLESETTLIYVRAENADMCEAITTLSITVYFAPSVTALVDGTSVEILATGLNPPFQYSIDGVNYGSSNIFEGLEAGIYTVYVSSVQGCIGQVSFEITENPDIDYIPSIITPNGDGINDTWDINGIQYFPNSSVRLFDRYGKLIVDIKTGDSPTVWDARYLDEKLPSTTYWYIIELTDGRVFKGYLVVRNRNSKAQQ